MCFMNMQVEGKEEDSEVERWGERAASVDISDDALERIEAGAYERHQMERRRLQAKQQHSERRKAWLRKNQALLRVFLSYCSLHGAKGGGVTSVRMELLFLLQESQQVHTQKHTHSYTRVSYVIFKWIKVKIVFPQQKQTFLSLTLTVGDHSEAAAVSIASAHNPASAISLHCCYQDGHSQSRSPPQQPHPRHPPHHHPHGNSATSRHHG